MSTRPGSIGNLRAATNGTRLHRLIVGKLPTKLHRVQRYCRQYRATLEQALIDAKGTVDIVDAHWIDSAAKHEQHAGVCRHLLRERMASMDTSDIVKCSESIAKATEARNRAVEKLGLVVTPEDRDRRIIELLYGPREPESDPWAGLDDDLDASPPADTRTRGQDARGDAGATQDSQNEQDAIQSE